jgi:hypothetical protein
MFLLLLAMALALSAGSLFAEDASGPIRMRVDFGGTQADIEMQAGEPVRLTSHGTGEVLTLRAVPQPGATPKVQVEVSHSNAKALSESETSELIELTVGETAKTRHLSSSVGLELVSAPAVAEAVAPKAPQFQVNLELPGGRTVMAIGDIRPDEMVKVRDSTTGMYLGFRPSFTQGGRASDIEIFSLGAAKASGGYRFVARVPMGGEFSVGGDKLGLSETADSPVKIKGSIEAPQSGGMWEESAFAGAASEPVYLRARWDGGPWVDGVNYDGHMFRIEVPGVAGPIGLAASPATKSDERSVSVFQVKKVPGGGETLKQLDTMMVREDQTTRANALEGRLELQVLSHRPRRNLKGSCWLGCGGGTTAHGCGVSCGGTDCCVGICCRD